MSRLSSSQWSRLSLLGLGMLLAGCSSLNQKLNLPKELPKQIVMSKLAIFHSDVSANKKDETEKPFSDFFLSCMDPLLDRYHDEDIFQKIFEEINTTSNNNTLLGFFPEKFRKGDDFKQHLHELITNKHLFNSSVHLFEIDLKGKFGELIGNDTKLSGKKDQFEAIMKGYLKAYFNSDESKPGFVTRDGTKYKFSGPSTTGGNVSINHTQIGADLARISFEAIRDTFFQIPVIKNSTLAELSSSDTESLYGLHVNIYEEEKEGTWKINENLAYTYNNVNFDEIETNANKAESMVATAIGKAIRGGSLGSLNNEALARTIETAIGVLARHTIERAYWCNAIEKNKESSTTNKS